MVYDLPEPVTNSLVRATNITVTEHNKVLLHLTLSNTAKLVVTFSNHQYTKGSTQWRTEGGLGGSNPPPKFMKALQNRAKLNPIVKSVKNC